jgi:hypothetical protein
MMARFSRITPIVALLLALLPAIAFAQKAPSAKEAKPAKPKAERPSSKFLRVTRDARGNPIAMETSILRYEPIGGDREGLQVDLIGAVHVGDKKYYEALNEAFDKYEIVLYELVAPPGTKIPKGGGAGGDEHPVRMLQQGLKSVLNLEFQLEQVDYTKKHFVHADMSPDQFAKSMKDRGESFLSIFFRMMQSAMAQQASGVGQVSDAELLLALLSKDRSWHLKRIMAEQFTQLDGVMEAIDGPKGSTLIGERNKVALDVLKKQIDSGKRKVAIFYGAGHYPDMDKRLAGDFKLKAGEPQWIEAWDLRAPQSKSRKKTPSPPEP